MLDVRCLLALVALVAPQAALVAGRVDYCNKFTFTNNSTYMQYNKELIEAEYAVQNQFKAIHCCGKGYRSIEWLKDGAAYPWASGVSNLILYPEAANQTLYTQRAGRLDSGNYTCRMRNDTHRIDHTIALHVAEIPTDTPRATVTPNDKSVELGGEVRFYCEAFVGRVNLADAHSDIKWRRVRPEQIRTDRGEKDKAYKEHDNSDKDLDNPDKDLENPDKDKLDINQAHNFKEILTKRENEDIVGAYLYIARVRPEDYGQYVCTVRSNDVVSEMRVTLHYSGGAVVEEVARAVPWRALVIGALLGGAALLSAAVLYARCWPRVALAARLLHARRTRHDTQLSDKEYDVLVVCTAVDGELTRGALLPTLALKYHYRTAHLQLTTQPDTWYDQVCERVRACRSLVCVLSPTQHTPSQLLTALKQLHALPVPPVIVLLQDLPKLKREAKDERGESLVSLLRRTKLLAWRHVQDRAFWTSLRLALPLPPPRHARPPHNTALHTNKMKTSGVSMVELVRGARDASRSGSLDALV